MGFSAMQRLLRHPITLLTVTVVATIFYFSLDKSAQDAQKSLKNLEVINQETVTAKEEVGRLEAEAKESGNQFYKEKVMRDELLLQKPGEYTLQVTTTAENNAVEAPKTMSETPWQQWKKLLFEP